jgi:hypothetical protein
MSEYFYHCMDNTLDGSYGPIVDFGPTSGLHSNIMPIIWGPAANVAILLAYYRYRKIWAWAHGAFFVFAVAMTLGCSIPILTTTGIIPEN